MVISQSGESGESGETSVTRKKGTAETAAKTKTITVQVDERLASEIEGTTVHNWRTTTFASGKRRVYATFESVKTVGGMR